MRARPDPALSLGPDSSCDRQPAPDTLPYGRVLRPPTPAQPGPSGGSPDATVCAGRLSAAARALLSDEPAAQAPAVWRKAAFLFLPAASASAASASVAKDFSDLLADAEAFGDGATVPRSVSRDEVVTSIHRAPRATAPGPSGLRMEHLQLLTEGGQDALLGVVELLVSNAAVTRVPAAAAHVFAHVYLLLLAQQGGDGADGLPGLRPIGMPETLRKVATSALAAMVRRAAAQLLAPAQLGVEVSKAFERLVHELETHLAHHVQHAIVR